MREFLRKLFGLRPPPAASTLIDTGLPFEVITVRGLDAVAVRQSLLARKGITPVILGNDKDVALMREGMEGELRTVQAVLEEADRLDLDAWMAARRAEDPDLYTVPPGTWPVHTSAPRELSVPLEVLTRKPRQTVLIGLVPTGLAWEVPAHVHYGDWNACPPPSVHVAMHRRWHKRWGGQIACMSSEVIECTVQAPPLSRQDALELAREQMVYCPDIVHQGAQSVEALAAALFKAGTWFFWWD